MFIIHNLFQYDFNQTCSWNFWIETNNQTEMERHCQCQKKCCRQGCQPVLWITILRTIYDTIVPKSKLSSNRTFCLKTKDRLDVIHITKNNKLNCFYVKKVKIGSVFQTSFNDCLSLLSNYFVAYLIYWDRDRYNCLPQMHDLFWLMWWSRHNFLTEIIFVYTMK